MQHGDVGRTGNPIWPSGWLFGALCACFLGSATLAQNAEPPTLPRQPTPQIFSFENFPFPVRVPRGLDELEPVGEPFEYNRRLPILGKEAADRGIVLPPPWGASLLGVYNRQISVIDELSVALSIDGTTPSKDADLIKVDFVTMGDSLSETSANQFKVDLWVLPFLNVYATRGRVLGKADLEVNVDLDGFNDALPNPGGLPWCGGPRQDDCGEVSWKFSPKIDSDTYTLGLVGIKNWDRTIATLSGSYTFSASRKDTAETVIEVANVGLRVGRLYNTGRNITFTPYLGANYTYSDNIVRGTATSPETLPNGEPLKIRFETRQRNRSNWSGTAGFAVGINDRWNANLDMTAGPSLQRVVFGVTARF